jgi:hypothetical protein
LTAGTSKGNLVELVRGVKTHHLMLSVVASVTIAGSSGGSVIARGIMNLLSRLRLLENGNPQFDLIGEILDYLTSRDQESRAVVVDLTAATAATYTISAEWVLPFSEIMGADPAETAYVDRDSRFPTQLETTWTTTGDNGILISGTGSTVNSINATLSQLYDPVTDVMPFFLPRMEVVQSAPFTGTKANFEFDLNPRPGYRLESIILRSVTDGVTNDTVLNGNVTLRGDKVRYIDTMPAKTVLNMNRRFLKPGIAQNVRLGLLEFLTRYYGKLSEEYVVGQDSNLRFIVDVTNGGSSSHLEAYLIERETVPGFTRALAAGW